MHFTVIAAVAIALLVGSMYAARHASSPNGLYDRLGSRPVVDEFVQRVGSDARVSGLFAATVAASSRLASPKVRLIEQEEVPGAAKAHLARILGPLRADVETFKQE